MHLKSLTLRGFKSFASSTTLHFEPGITCVVGPNGSGKSNVVDAIAWVLGEQGAKALRGGTMSDVIFAGTSARPALGRAEVLLTIDNSDGALPIEYSEVTVGRLMFRSGESEYTINGSSCRLLDIQELMSDSGIGRELHVVVGQGTLDSVLNARPEDRRAFVEEAAGVLKHRKRKEKALRKLEAMQANLTRLSDLSAELRRQLGPLGRQAEIARRAGTIQAALRDARMRLLADDLHTARAALDDGSRDEELLRARLTQAESALLAERDREAVIEASLAAAAPRVTRAQDTWYALASLRERVRGTRSLAGERARHLRAAGAEQRTGRDPDELEREAAAVRERETALGARLTEDRERLAAVVARRAELEAALAAEEKALVAAARAAADQREGLVRLTGSVETARSRAVSAEGEITRTGEAVDAARERAAQTAEQAETLGGELEELSDGRSELDAHAGAAADALTAAQQRLDALVAEERAADRDRASWQARRDALALSLAPKDGAGALQDSGLAGVLGRVAGMLTVAAGAEVAVAAALGTAADALAVAGPDAAAAALHWLRDADAGRATFLVEGGPSPARTGAVTLPDGARRAADLVTPPPALAGAVAALLADTVVVPDLDAALTVVAAHPDLRAVTADGDVLGAAVAAGGSTRAPSLLEIQAAADEAAERVTEAARRGEAARDTLGAAKAEVARARDEVDTARGRLHQTQARAKALREAHQRLAATARSAAAEADKLERRRTEAEQARDRAHGDLAELEARLAAAAAAPVADEMPVAERDRLGSAVSAVRAEEVEGRLAVRTSEERARALSGRADALVRQAASERSAREAASRRREARERGAAIAEAVAEGADTLLRRLERSLEAAAEERTAAEAARAEHQVEAAAVRDRLRTVEAELTTVRDAAHRDEMIRAERRLKVEALEAKALEEHGTPPDAIVAEYGPSVPVPADTEDASSVPYVRAEQEQRAATADRQLAKLGRVNPLALEEYEALKERASFLSTQLEDLKNTRRDLLLVVAEVDERVREVFRTAFEDTAREFEIVFSTLFPGGEGRLVLTDPEDMLMTGIEVEARPPGKKVKRLSLLSGGERSLTAIALLIAIFRARPSPFYVLDEVEAALDDRNLGRLLDALEGLRERSQLIVITHQKRTMEIADALYGVSMRGDGVTTVISQRLRERATA